MESTNKYRCVQLSTKCSSQLRNISLNEAALISEHFPAVSNIHCCRICENCRFKLKDAIKIADNQRSTETEIEDLHDLTSGELYQEYKEVPTCSSYTKSLERNELVDNINKHVIPHLGSHPSPMKRKYLERDSYCKKNTANCARYFGFTWRWFTVNFIRRPKEDQSLLRTNFGEHEISNRKLLK